MEKCLVIMRRWVTSLVVVHEREGLMVEHLNLECRETLLDPPNQNRNFFPQTPDRSRTRYDI